MKTIDLKPYVSDDGGDIDWGSIEIGTIAIPENAETPVVTANNNGTITLSAKDVGIYIVQYRVSDYMGSKGSWGTVSFYMSDVNGEGEFCPGTDTCPVPNMVNAMPAIITEDAPFNVNIDFSACTHISVSGLPAGLTASAPFTHGAYKRVTISGIPTTQGNNTVLFNTKNACGDVPSEHIFTASVVVGMPCTLPTIQNPIGSFNVNGGIEAAFTRGISISHYTTVHDCTGIVINGVPSGIVVDVTDITGGKQIHFHGDADAAGDFDITIAASNECIGGAPSYATLHMTGTVFDPVEYYLDSIPDATQYVAYYHAEHFSGSAPMEITIVTKPDWVDILFDQDTGDVTFIGTPSGDDITEDAYIEFEIHNCFNQAGGNPQGVVTAEVHFGVSAFPTVSVLSGLPLAPAIVGVPYSHNIVFDGIKPLDFVVETIDDWMNLSIDGQTGVLTVSGTPTAGAHGTLSIGVSSAINEGEYAGTYLLNESISINTCQPITVSGGASYMPNAYIGTPYSHTADWNGTAPFALTVAEKPSWMTISINPSTGTVTFGGTPTAGSNGTGIPVELFVSTCNGQQTDEMSVGLNVLQPSVATLALSVALLDNVGGAYNYRATIANQGSVAYSGGNFSVNTIPGEVPLPASGIIPAINAGATHTRDFSVSTYQSGDPANVGAFVVSGGNINAPVSANITSYGS